jgi:glycosyltransferase involved in cell wall biosynthesis
MLFVRRAGVVNGGQIKVFDYAKHVRSCGLFDPYLYLTPESTPLDPSLDFDGLGRADDPDEADAFFLAGFDWRVLDAAGVRVGDRSVVNLIQGFAHATPGDDRYAFLERPALRVCVSRAVADAIAQTGRVSGPIVTIENGLALPPAPAGLERAGRVVVAGAKNPEMARSVAAGLERRGIPVDVLAEFVEREAFLDAFAGARIAAVLPHEREGFFLPALEAMARGCAVVVPDCLGTRTFCIDGESALVCEYRADAIVAAVVRLWEQPALVEALVAGGLARAAEHSLERERSEFLTALTSYVGREGVTA